MVMVRESNGSRLRRVARLGARCKSEICTGTLLFHGVNCALCAEILINRMIDSAARFLVAVQRGIPAAIAYAPVSNRSVV